MGACPIPAPPSQGVGRTSPLFDRRRPCRRHVIEIAAGAGTPHAAGRRLVLGCQEEAGMDANLLRVMCLVVLAPCLGATMACSTNSASCGSESKCGLDCQASSTTPVAWTDQTALGNPEAVFAPFAGSCQAQFSWDATGWSSTAVVEPVQGASTLSVTVVLDTSSARFVTQTPSGCSSLLEVDGTATLALPEGKVVDQRPFTLSASAGFVPPYVAISLKEAEFGPWVSIQKTDPAAELAMSIQISPPAQGCSGQVMLSYQRVSNGIGQGGGGPFASWSVVDAGSN